MQAEEKKKTLVSACLMGIHCRYDGRHSWSEELSRRFEEEKLELIPICPEQLGGLPTPRPCAEIEGGDGRDVLDGTARVVQVESREEVTEAFLRGARAALKIGRITGAKQALLKGGSPSCGCDGIKVDGERVEGPGVTAALLEREGFNVQGVQ